jgi:hypothetical protein
MTELLNKRCGTEKNLLKDLLPVKKSALFCFHMLVLALPAVSSSSSSCCFHLEHRTSVKRFVSLHFLNLRQSAGLLGQGIGPSQGRYLTQTDIHALSGIRTHDSSVQASEDVSCPRPRDHCDRPLLH